MFQENISLKPFNTFGIDAKASKFAAFSSVDQLINLLKQEEIENNQLLVLGGGSNILLTKDYEGIVLKNDLKGIQIVGENETEYLVKASGGEVWNDFVKYAIKNDMGGIENLSLIPGSVGAAPMQNIGAYGVEIKDVFYELEALNLTSLKLEKFDREACQFGYRESVFKRALKNQYIITSMTLKLSKQHQLNTSYGAIEAELTNRGIKTPTIKDVSEAVIAIRESKLPDPKKIGNSGSFFKNPVISKRQFDDLQVKFPTVAHYPIDENSVKIAAGWLIDQAGWKGKTLGNYGVHKNQALVLVNYGGAKGEEIYQLSESILVSIEAKFGIVLEREVNIIK